MGQETKARITIKPSPQPKGVKTYENRAEDLGTKCGNKLMQTGKRLHIARETRADPRKKRKKREETVPKSVDHVPKTEKRGSLLIYRVRRKKS